MTWQLEYRIDVERKMRDLIEPLLKNIIYMLRGSLDRFYVWA